MYDCIDQCQCVLQKDCERSARISFVVSGPSLVPVSSLAECTVSGGTDPAEIRNTCWTSGVYIDLDKWSNEPTDVRYSLKQFVSGC